MTYLDDLQLVKQTLLEVTKQTKGLAVGLQNVAPAQGAPPASVQYLFETTEQLEEKMNQVNQLIDEWAS